MAQNVCTLNLLGKENRKTSTPSYFEPDCERTHEIMMENINEQD